MIQRYTRPEMGALWETENRFAHMLVVEKAAARVQAGLGLIPRSAAAAIESQGRFDVSRILEIEKVTRHDVIAFVSNVAENVGPHGRYVHFGLTSSDVLDTALSLQIREASALLLSGLEDLRKALVQSVKKYRATLCAGRTHGMHAEPTTFGFKLAGFLAELVRAKERFERASRNCQIAKLSGAVGTYSSQTEQVEARVAKALGLSQETVATQVIPRDRHAELMTSLALLGGFIERLAVELRHLQRTEVGEALEGFQKGQKGSSAMPHKRNPISAENLTGQARMLRTYALASLENMALWHERDISHSAVERVVFPDAFILADYSVARLTEILKNLEVVPERMLENMRLSGGQLFSSHVLLALVDKGWSREKAYEKVQSLSHSQELDGTLESRLLEDIEVKSVLKPREIHQIFSGKTHIRVIDEHLRRVLSRLEAVSARAAAPASKKGQKKSTPRKKKSGGRK